MIILDKTIYQKLFHDYYVPLCNLAYRYLYSEEESEDIVQEVFANFWQKRKELNVNTSLKNYLYSSVKNKCIEKIRRKKIEERYISEQMMKESDSAEDEDDFEKLLLINKVNKSIDKLPKKCKQVFTMAKIEGLTYNEISEELGISVKTVEGQMRRAFILIREYVAK